MGFKKNVFVTTVAAAPSCGSIRSVKRTAHLNGFSSNGGTSSGLEDRKSVV